MKRMIVFGVTASMLALALLLWSMAAYAPASAQNTACYMEQGGAKWVCADGGEFEVRSGATLDVQSGASFNVDGTLDVDGAVTLNSTLDVDGAITSGTGAITLTDDVWIGTGDLVIDTRLQLDPTSADTITQDEPITPTASVHPVTADGTVSTGSIVAGTAGDVLIIHNSGSNTVVISDTGTLKLSGNIELGQYDSLTLISDGTNWIQLTTSNN